MKIPLYFCILIMPILVTACYTQTHVGKSSDNQQSYSMPTTLKENSIMNNIPSPSRPAPPKVEAIMYKGVRYEQDMESSRYGGTQLGGYLVAIDAVTDERLWMVKVYEISTQVDAPFQPGRYFRSMRLLAESDEIEIESEVGGIYLVDLSNQSSRWVSGSDSMHK